jgi:hypothetical protein
MVLARLLEGVVKDKEMGTVLHFRTINQTT